jgi:hypothetical protein
MPKFELREKDGSQIVRDTETDVYYLPLDTYAKQVGLEVHDLIAEVRYILESYHKDDQDFDQVLDLGSLPIKGVDSRYLIPANLVFVWMLSHCRTKAIELGSCAMTEEVKYQFASIGDPIKVNKKVRLKEGVKPVPALEVHKNYAHFQQGEIGIVFENPTPQLYAGYPKDDVMLLVRKPGTQNPYKVRVNIKDLELMED